MDNNNEAKCMIGVTMINHSPELIYPHMHAGVIKGRIIKHIVTSVLPAAPEGCTYIVRTSMDNEIECVDDVIESAMMCRVYLSNGHVPDRFVASIEVAPEFSQESFYMLVEQVASACIESFE